MSTTLVSLAAALLSALLNGIGTVAQALAARRAGGTGIVRQRAYQVGWALDLVGWGLSVVALRHLPLIVVQPLLATSLAVAVLLMAPVLGVRTSRRASAAVVVVVLSVAVLAWSAAPGRAPAPPAWLAPALGVGLLLVAAGYAVARRVRHASTTAGLAGLSWTVSALAARGMHGTGDWVDLPSQPLAWVTVGGALVGALAFARAVEVAGEHGVATVTAWLWVVQIAVPSVLGSTLLGDPLRPGWTVPAALALVAACGASVALSASSSRRRA
ncbi:hypothetical protein [Solicola sp. PLA-1-18]|uniref:hypothetical protein n=1 Tax=Solicola sp. PLA-1-18 TaxID=3380532 RepID=UPI003B778F4C